MAEMVMHRRRSAREQEMAKAAAEARQDNVPVSFRRAGHEPASVEVRSPTHPRAQNSVRGAKVRPGPSVATVGRSFMKRDFTDKEHMAARKIILFWKRRRNGYVRKTQALARAIEKRQTQRNIREICTYLIFLVLFTFSSIVVSQDQRIFHLANGIKGQVAEAEFEPDDVPNVFKNMFDIQVAEDIWQWARGPLYLGLYTGATEDNRDPRRYPGTLYGTNYIVGGVTFSQLRVKARDCRDSLGGMKLQSASTEITCREDGTSGDAFEEDLEDKATFGDNGVQFTWEGNHGESLWSVEESRDASWYRLTDWQASFPSGAYRVVLPNRNATKAWSMIKEMEAGGYFDLKTRVLMVEFTTYNPGMDYWCHAVIYIEQPASGSLLVTWQTDTLRLYNVLESPSTVTAVIEVFVALFFLYYIFVEVTNCRRYGKKYFGEVGNLVHNLNIFVYILTWMFRLMMIFKLPPIDDVVLDSDVAYQFHAGIQAKAISVYMTSVNAFLCWLKLVKYLSYVPRFALVSGTLRRSAQGVTGFSVVFLTVFYGFSAAFMLTHGGRVMGYRNLTQSGLTLLRSLLGDFDFLELQKGQWLMGPVLFILFICVAVFVVLNVLIAIISDAYSDAQESLMHSNDVALGQEIKDYVLNTIEGVPVLGKWFHKGRMKTVEMAAKVQTHGAKTLSTVSRKSRGLLKPISRSPSGDSKGQTPDNFAETKSVAAVRRHSLSNPAPGMLVADGPTRRGGNGTSSATTSPSHHASSSHEQAMMPGMIASERADRGRR